MEFPAELKYSASHEWVRVDGTRATIGITDYAQDALGDVVYVEIPDPDREVTAGKPFGVIESVKAAEDLYAPVSGKVVEANTAVIDNPEIVNQSCYGDAWMMVVELSNPTELDALMDADTYRMQCEAEHH